MGVEHQARYRELFLSLDGDVPGRLATQAYLDSSSAIYHGEVIDIGFLPMVYDASQLELFERTVAMTSRILNKMTERFIADAEYRALFEFPPLLDYLIRIPSRYPSCIPIARIDIFLSPEDGDFKFCEFNTDGTSAMNEDREAAAALTRSQAFKAAADEMPLAPQELFEPWIDAFMSVYSGFENATDDPCVAILDYWDKTSPTELLEFKRRFEARGLRCIVCDMASVSYRDGALYGVDVHAASGAGGYDESGGNVISGGGNGVATDAPQDASGGEGGGNGAAALPPEARIDAIYRRAVTSDIVEDLEQAFADPLAAVLEAIESGAPSFGAVALIRAAVDGAAALIGSFKTQVAHSKTSFRMAHDPATLAFLDDDERDFIRRHVPHTKKLTAADVALGLYRDDRQDWIVKPVDGYATHGVFAGKALSAQEWDAILRDAAQGDYVIQEYCAQYPMPQTLPVPVDAARRRLFSTQAEADALIAKGGFDPKTLLPCNVLTGLYAYDGRFAGVFVRAGAHPLIVGFHGGMTVAAFTIQD